MNLANLIHKPSMAVCFFAFFPLAASLGQYSSVMGTDSAHLAWVQHYASGSTFDSPTAMDVDASGNVYVTGVTYAPNTGADYTTVKYDPSGVEQWVARYDRIEYHDVVAAMVVDDEGNAYVTGRSGDANSNYDYLTIRYNPSGEQMWVAQYNGPGNGSDEATAIGLDSLGNVYVTGFSPGDSTGYDVATIKYNSLGIEQWVSRYTGEGSRNDFAFAMAVDAAGNTYVTGYNTDAANVIGYLTIKYDTDGIEQWVEEYHGPGMNDNGKDIAVDAMGNVYVTGYSDGGVTTGVDYATVKYNSAGTEQWVARYNGPANETDNPEAIAVDNAGNIYVTGVSDQGPTNGNDYVTIKYDGSGVEQWVTNYNGPASSAEYVKDLAADDAGNVYVTGHSIGSTGVDDFATVKYNTSGVQQWVASHGGVGNDGGFVVAVDMDGNTYVFGSESRPVTYADGDFTTIKYDGFGIEQWVGYYRGWDNSLAFSRSIASDGAGGAYVTGSSTTKAGTEDYTTIRYNGLGVEQWISRYNGPGDAADMAAGLAVGPSGSVYVTGTSRDSSDDYATVKYDEDGVQEWVQRYNGPGGTYEEAMAIASDTPGNVYVTGASNGTTSFDDFATIKYNPSGVQQWVARYNGPGNESDQANAIVVDDAGNCYVTGSSAGSLTFLDYATVKYNSAGVQQWVARYDGPGGLNDEAFAIAVDLSGNVYVTGRSVGSTTEYDWATVKYDAQGVEQWAARYTSAGTGFDEGKSIAVDASGAVYVAGISYNTSYDGVVIKYSSSGVEEWVRLHDGPAGGDDLATSVTMDNGGDIYVVGSSRGIDTGGDILALRYDPSGTIVWENRYDEWSSPDDAGASVAVEANGTVWITGTSSFPNNEHISTTLKYNQDPVMAVEDSELPPSFASLEQNYPNPFNPATTIRYAIPSTGKVTLRIYSLLGEEVRTLVDGVQTSGEYVVSWNSATNSGLPAASGIYFYRLVVSSTGKTETLFSRSGKMILLR